MPNFQGAVKGRPPFSVWSIAIPESNDFAYKFMAARMPNRGQFNQLCETWVAESLSGNLHFVYTSMTSVDVEIASYVNVSWANINDILRLLNKILVTAEGSKLRFSLIYHYDKENLTSNFTLTLIIASSGCWILWSVVRSKTKVRSNRIEKKAILRNWNCLDSDIVWRGMPTNSLLFWRRDWVSSHVTRRTTLIRWN